MENWAEIRRLHRADSVPIKAIARRSGVARNTVRAALASELSRGVPDGCGRVVPGAGVRAGVGHPEGLAWTPVRTPPCWAAVGAVMPLGPIHPPLVGIVRALVAVAFPAPNVSGRRCSP